MRSISGPFHFLHLKSIKVQSQHLSCVISLLNSILRNLENKDPFGMGIGLFIGWAERKNERYKKEN